MQQPQKMLAFVLYDDIVHRSFSLLQNYHARDADYGSIKSDAEIV